MPYDDYDRGFGAPDANAPEATTQPETGPPPDVAPPLDAADAAPGCVMPGEPQCDADITSDPSNCGACGRQCLKLNSACIGKLCDVELAFAAIFINPVGVGVDDKYFYGLGTIAIGSAEGGVAREKVDLTGFTSIATYTKDPRHIALSKDGNDLYWTQAGAIAHSLNNPQSDGAANVAEVFVAGQNNPTAIAIDANYLYWTNPPPDGEVWRASLKNPADAHAIVAHSDAMNAYSVAVDDQYVYFTSNTQGGAVWRMDKSGGPPAPIAQGQSYPSDIFVDPEAVYWTNSSITNGAVMRLAKGGTTPISLAGTRQQPGGVVARDPYVYWYESGTSDKNVLRVAKCGGTPLILAAKEKVTDLAVQERNVYWTTGNAVNRVAR